jgi:hypothetical protein
MAFEPQLARPVPAITPRPCEKCGLAKRNPLHGFSIRRNAPRLLRPTLAPDGFVDDAGSQQA